MKLDAEKKDRILVPLSGIGILLASVATLVLALYVITIVVRLIFVWGA